MSHSLTDVRGIGPSTAPLLIAEGIDSVKELATASMARVAAVRGFSDTRAAEVIKAARALLWGNASDSETKVAKPKKSKAKEKKKDGKKAEGKKGKKDKKKKKKKGKKSKKK